MSVQDDLTLLHPLKLARAFNRIFAAKGGKRQADDWRQIDTRYDRTANAFFPAVAIAASVISSV